MPEPQTTGQSGVVWAALEVAGRVAKVDARRGRVLDKFTVRGRPHNLNVAPDGTVIATLQRAGLISMIRGGRVRHVTLGGSPHDVKAAGGLVVVANEGAARLDLLTLGGRNAGAIPLRADPHDVAVSPNGKLSWVTLDGSDDIAVVSLGRRRVLRYISTGKRPHDLLFTPDGRRVWVTDWVDGIHVFSRRGSLLRTIRQGVEAHHLAFTPDGRQAWISDNGARGVLIVSTSRFRVIAKRPVGGAPHHVTITPNGERAVVTNHDRGTLVVFDVGSRRRLKVIPVGAGPHGVWAAPT
jgi:YVTN family beta-propeller protein